MAWPKIKDGKNVLISAPTGSGKTLSAFFAIIDGFIQRGLKGSLDEKTYVVYVSPLKALSNDIDKNLQFPIKSLKEELEAQGKSEITINVGLRTGDTTPSQRTAMYKKHPHILVSTPESLYILLTSVSGRKLLKNVETVIVDEIHALVQDKRGSHLALSLERLEHLTPKKLKRIGLSATQKPIEKVACFLTGSPDFKNPNCEIVSVGLKRKLELSIDVPRSPLSPVMANEVWEEVYDRLEQLIGQHKTTLIFVHSRRLAERMSHNLSNRLGKENVTSHHGSMSKEHRLDAETRLKEGTLKALVATASLELGIDIGGIDLVCQIGSPRSISSLLQRVGRSGHYVGGVPKGIMFPLSRDELMECIAVIDAIRIGELDELIIPEKPIDILAQQVVAELAGTEEYDEDELFELATQSYPYRNLERKEFDETIEMLSEGYATRRGRRGAYLHHDIVNKKLRARKNARLTSLISGGAIPDNFDYDVILEPTSTFIGTLNEDFATESLPGDVFQLGSNSWRLLKIENGKVRVEDAKGAAPSIPFWLGEAPGRTKEMSEAVSRIREEVSNRLGDLSEVTPITELAEEETPDDKWKQPALNYLMKEVGIGFDAADQAINYLATGKLALGQVPTRDSLLMERFFDEAGDMHLVIHSPFGSRLNRAWGLSLRKRFCRKFNFELQAAATEDNIIMSLGSTHSFPVEEVYQYLNPKTVREVLVQALLDAPMFEIRWRWNASRALAILRRQGNRKVPPQIQRSNSEDLIALVFPDQLACLENIEGEREVPDHPLVNQTIHDCLTEAMDIDELEALLTRIKSGDIELIAKDLREPSPFAQEIINAKPYAYLDPGEATERRTNNIQSRGFQDPTQASDLATLDFAAIQTVKIEAWPQVRNRDELHDALFLGGFITQEEGELGDGLNSWQPFFQELIDEKRATLVRLPINNLWVATERLPHFEAVYDQLTLEPQLIVPDRLKKKDWEPSKALVELLRGRLEILGPVIVESVSESMSLEVDRIDQAMIALENDGFVFRGHFNPGTTELEWCERRLLARIHRYTIQKLRSEIEPVSAADYMRFIFHWHGLLGEDKAEGPGSLLEIIEKLEGYEAPAAAWEGSIIPDRLKDYDYMWLDVLCISGQVTWGRFRPILVDLDNGKKAPSPVKNTPLCLLRRSHVSYWKGDRQAPELSANAVTIIELIKKKGASFYNDLIIQSGLLNGQVEEAISELVSHGLVTSDSYSGLRALLVPLKFKSGRKRNRKDVFTMDQAGRWTLIEEANSEEMDRQKYLEDICMTLLKRYGVLFRKLADKEQLVPSWRELIRTLRVLEARGIIRGGRFVQGVWGEQFALSEALTLLRKIRKTPLDDELITISAADPLNLTGIITPGRKVSAYYGNRILYRNGIPVAVTEGKEVKMLEEFEGEEKWKIHHAVIERNIPPKLRQYLGRGIV